MLYSRVMVPDKFEQMINVKWCGTGTGKVKILFKGS
jgi:hypothetical protein